MGVSVARARMLFWMYFLWHVNLTWQAINIPPEPELILETLDVDVQEHEDRRVDLNGGNPVLTCEDADGDAIRAYVQAASPSSPCGVDCFQLEPCGSPIEYCLFYNPDIDFLSYSTAPSYSLSIICTDDVEFPSSKDLTVNVISNTPPQFVPSTTRETVAVNGLPTAQYRDITSVGASDADGDPITWIMTFSPPHDLISYSRGNGDIYFNHNSRLVCETSIQATVFITDNYNADVGPKIIDIDISGNVAAVVNNLDTTIYVAENTAANTVIRTLSITDTISYQRTVTMTTPSQTGLELYELNGLQVRLRISPDYERAETRSTQLFFVVNDGYCFSETYSLTVEITDVNEPPEFRPSVTRALKFVYEGTSVTVDHGMTVYDDDDGETLTYSLASGGAGIFQVDPTSGQITAPNEVDIDNNRVSVDYTLTIRATDKDGLTDDLPVLIRVKDANDQAPYFQVNTYTFAATLCSMLGDVLGSVTGADDDSTFQNNNVFYFGGSSGTTAVTSDGQVVLSAPMANGDSNTGTATITDTGLYPGTLSGTSITYTVTCCSPCPTTAAPATGGGTTAGGGGGGGTTSAPATVTPLPSNSASGLGDALPWLLPALLGGLIWLALTSFLIYRFCFPCKNPCPRRPKPVKVKVQPKPQQPPPKPVKPNRPPKPPTPKPAFKIDTPPPLTPEPVPMSYRMGFWTEKFTDQEYVSHPKRDTKPIPIEDLPDEGNPQTPPPQLRLGPDNAHMPAFIPAKLNAPKKGVQANRPPTRAAWDKPPTKSRCCVIL